MKTYKIQTKLRLKPMSCQITVKNLSDSMDHLSEIFAMMNLNLQSNEISSEKMEESKISHIQCKTEQKKKKEKNEELELELEKEVQKKRTRENAGRDEMKDIKQIVYSINKQTLNGKKICESFKSLTTFEIIEARERSGNRGKHYDFQIRCSNNPEAWVNIEHKGSQKYVPIKDSDREWTAGVQFHNGPAEKYTITKNYTRIWYDHYIASSAFKTKWNLSSPIPSFDEWYEKDVKVQGDPKTLFGKELKKVVREMRGKKGSLLEEREPINKLFNPSDEDLKTLNDEVLVEANKVLLQKDYWVVIHGNLNSDFHCKWYNKFTIPKINKVSVRKEKDIWFDFECDEFCFSGILRWGKGAGFSNLRFDLR